MEFRAYTPGDEHAILDLFKSTYGRPMSSEFWNWRFLKNPTDRPQIYLAYEGDILAGHYAVSPVKILIQGETHLSGLSMTTMTHKDFQGRGLFTTLAQTLYSEMARQGYALVHGFPNNNSYYGFMSKLAWEPAMEVPMLKCSEAAPQAKPYTIGTSLDLEAYDKLWKHCKISHSTGVDRDGKFVQWRYIQNPANKYEFLTISEGSALTAALVFKQYALDGTPEIDILDCIAADDASLDAALKAARHEFLTNRKVKALNAWVNIHQKDYLTYFKNKFIHNTPLTFLGGRILKTQSLQNNLWQRWNLSLGDSDVF